MEPNSFVDKERLMLTCLALTIAIKPLFLLRAITLCSTYQMILHRVKKNVGNIENDEIF